MLQTQSFPISKKPLKGVSSRKEPNPPKEKQSEYLELPTLLSGQCLSRKSAENTQIPYQIHADFRETITEPHPAPKQNKLMGKIDFENDNVIRLNKKREKGLISSNG